MQEEQEEQPQEVDFSHDSSRLIGNGERVKCMVIMDVTYLSDRQKRKFLDRSLAALTRMGKKVMEEKD